MRDELGRPYVTDQQTATVGILMAKDNGLIYLRPIHGGPEWAVDAARLRPATPAEVKAASR